MLPYQALSMNGGDPLCKIATRTADALHSIACGLLLKDDSSCDIPFARSTCAGSSALLVGRARARNSRWNRESREAIAVGIRGGVGPVPGRDLF